MRSDLFEIVEAINDVFNSLIDFGAQVLFKIIELIADALDFIIDSFFKGLLMIIDRKRVSYIDESTKQENFTKELEALIAASKVKDDAITNDNWTDNHTKAINELSMILYNECGWDEVSIHGYMREIVESVPGLEYRTEGDESS